MSSLLIFLLFILFSPPYLFQVLAGLFYTPIQTQLLISETFPNENDSMLHFFLIFWGAQNVAHFLKLKTFEWAELAVTEAAMDVTNICFN